MANVYHKDLTGTDLHVTKVHGTDHKPSGSDDTGMIVVSETEPASPVSGVIWIIPSSKSVYIYVVNAWLSLGAIGGI